MANPIIFQVQMPSGNTYDIADQYARDLIKELLNFHEYLGVTTSEIDDGSTINPVTIEGESVTAVAGDVVTRSTDSKEFVYSSTGVWQNFGNLSGLGALAFKDSASGSYTPAGSISASFTGTETTSTGTFTPEGSVSASFTGSSTTSTGVFTPEGSVSGSFTGSSTTSTGTFTPSGSIDASFTGSSTTSTGTFTPEGSVSSSGGTKTVTQLKTAGTLASCTMPTFTVSNEKLVITDGSYTAGTLPTGEDVSVGDGTVTSTFTGSEGSLSVTGTPSGTVSGSFTGTEGNLSVTGTPSGSISASFTGTEGNLSVSGTPSGSISASFTGTEGNLSVAGTPTGSVSGTFSGTADTITVS